jgi:hypothetical protein
LLINSSRFSSATGKNEPAGAEQIPLKGRKQRLTPVTWRSVGLAGAIGGLMLGFMMYLKHEKELGNKKKII